jgi:limonene-1,2-epoxide hydrolase
MAEFTLAGPTDKDACAENQPQSNEIVRDFLRACSGRDLDSALELVTDDIEYDNVPIGKVFGPAGVRSVLSGGITDTADEVEWVVLHQVGEGEVVMSERVDRFRIGENWLEIPVVGVFVLDGNKIKLWRDYFDLDSYRKQKSALFG